MKLPKFVSTTMYVAEIYVPSKPMLIFVVPLELNQTTSETKDIGAIHPDARLTSSLLPGGTDVIALFDFRSYA